MTREEWNKKAGHPMQAWAWGEFREKMGNRISRVTGDHQYLIVWSRIKLTPWWFGYVPMGPVPSEKDLNLLMLEAKRVGAIGIRMEPNSLTGTRIPKGLVRGRHLFKPKTYWVDLEKNEELLLTLMHPKCRYNIRLAEKHGVEIIENPNGLHDYLKLMFGKTTKRQKIYAHTNNYHRLMWEELSRQGIAHMFTATYEKKVIAAWIIYAWKDFAYYAYGAFDDDYKQVMAPNLGLWEIIKWAKKMGMRHLDLWGAEEGKGFSRFKEQFGPDLVEMVGTYDLPVNPVLYKLFRMAEEVRWKILRLIK